MALILFDFDGVLADTLGDLLQFGQEACRELGIERVPTRHDLDVLEVMSFATYGAQLGVPAPLLDEFVRRCLQKGSQKLTPPALFDGLKPVIERLARKNILAVVTSNNRENVSLFLAHHGLSACIHAIYGVDTPGSKSEKIARARRELADTAKPTFMVGDSLSDIRAAHEARVTSIAVSWGHQSVDKLSSAAPAFLVYAPSELLDVIDQFQTGVNQP